MIHRWLRPFGWALHGWAHLVRTQRHARFHAGASVLVLALGLWLRAGREDWCWLTVAMALVWSAEAFNSAVEQLADRITREQDPLIGSAKDVAAGAVLFTAVGAAIIGILRLGPLLCAKLGLNL